MLNLDLNEEIINPRRLETERRVLVMTAVAVERDAVLHGLGGDKRFDVMVAGVGSVAAAVKTAKVLASTEYGLVVSAGIAGGFPGRAEVGSLVVANKIIAADLGVETPEGFSSLAELGFGSINIGVDPSLVNKVTGALLAVKLSVSIGPIITVSTATGTTASAVEMARRVPGAAAEAMEGYGVALAAQNYGVSVLEIRVISNLVGPRDRTVWRIKEALHVLEEASAVLLEVLL
ncbi:MAG: futalosine hydrolase [Desulfitobacteriaceae bacterium]